MRARRRKFKVVADQGEVLSQQSTSAESNRQGRKSCGRLLGGGYPEVAARQMLWNRWVQV